MSSLDRELLDKAGLSTTNVAHFLGKSRQAVSKGVHGDRDYFSPNDLQVLSERVADEMSDRSAALLAAVGDLFQKLVERMGSSLAPPDPLPGALADASRVWLIFPGFSSSFAQQPDAYATVLDAISLRTPRSGRNSGSWLEIIAYCDSDQLDVEARFDQEWFRKKQIAIIECDIVSRMLTPTIVVDPHNVETLRCFTLTEQGFQPMATEAAVQQVKSFASHVTEKVRNATRDWKEPRPFNAQNARPSDVLTANVHKI